MRREIEQRQRLTRGEPGAVLDDQYEASRMLARLVWQQKLERRGIHKNTLSEGARKSGERPYL